jgi:hypothetical protein
MHKRRREASHPATLPAEHWERLSRKNPEEICEFSGATRLSPGELGLDVMAMRVVVNLDKKTLWRLLEGVLEPVTDPTLGLMTLVYLADAAPFQILEDPIGVRDLRDAHFFQGPHDLDTGPLIDRFGTDFKAFERAARSLGGVPAEMADIAFTIHPFPKIPLHYLLWAGDEDFAPDLKILFDRSIEHHLAADAIWGIVQVVSQALIQKSDNPDPA